MNPTYPNTYQQLVRSPTQIVPTDPSTVITPGATNVYGAWQNFGVLSSTYDTHILEVVFSLASLANNSKCSMVDIGIDPAGGTSFTSIISDVVLGTPGPFDDGTGIRPTIFEFYRRIPAGASVGIRGKQNHATPSTFRGGVIAWGKPSRPSLAFVGSAVETIGATAATSQGTAIVPGNAGEGAWTLIGTSTYRGRRIDIGYAIDNTNVTGQGLYIDVAYGDGATLVTVITRAHVLANPNEIVHQLYNGRFCDIPAGSALYARVRQGLGSAPNTGHSIALYVTR